MLPQVEPMPLHQVAAPFDEPDWLFEVKFDGFRALAYVENGQAKLVSRKDHTYQRFRDLAEAISTELEVENAILDGELVCLDAEGQSRFNDLMFSRGEVYFSAFDLLWVDGEDLRELPLVGRKERLRGVVPSGPSRLLYMDHVEEQGVELYELCCRRDLEGIVAKPKASPYRLLSGKTSWLKVKNPDYSQAEGRRELFDSRRRRK